MIQQARKVREAIDVIFLGCSSYWVSCKALRVTLRSHVGFIPGMFYNFWPGALGVSCPWQSSGWRTPGSLRRV